MFGRYLSWQVLKQPTNVGTCTYKHMHSQTIVRQTRIYTVSGTRTHTFYGSMHIARELPAVGDLSENRTPPVPLSSPYEPRANLRPTGATSFYSLLLCLMAACLLFTL